MGTSTAVLQLYKPDGTEFVDEAIQLNANWDRVETAVVADRARLTALERKGFSSKAADQGVTNSATLVNATNLSHAVAAGFTYDTTWVLRASATNFTPKIKVGFTFPTGDLNVLGHGLNSVDHTAGTSANAEHVHRQDSASPSTPTPYGVGTASVGILFRTLFVCTVSGTLQLQFAQNIATAATTTTVSIGSYVKWEVVA